jgi:hypothetical protein
MHLEPKSGKLFIGRFEPGQDLLAVLIGLPLRGQFKQKKQFF